MTNKYVELAAINVNDHVEKKNGLTYLSWAWALDQLLRRDPDASWSYPEPIRFGETMMVLCTVTAFGKQRTAQLPVMDHRNKPIPNPDAFQVNTAMQRCLVKAIALHGLGLYIYAGEDVPPDEAQAMADKMAADKKLSGAGVAQAAFDALPPEAQAVVRENAMEMIAFVEKEGDVSAAMTIYEGYEDHNEKLALWSQLPSNVRSALKKAAKSQPALAEQA